MEFMENNILDAIFEPGQIVPISGIFDIVNDNGISTGYQRIDVKGNIFPAVSQGVGFKLYCAAAA